MEDKITVEQFKEWLSELPDAKLPYLRNILAKASQIAEPTVNDIAGLMEELGAAFNNDLAGGCTCNCGAVVDEILSKYPTAPAPKGDSVKYMAAICEGCAPYEGKCAICGCDVVYKSNAPKPSTDQYSEDVMGITPTGQPWPSTEAQVEGLREELEVYNSELVEIYAKQEGETLRVSLGIMCDSLSDILSRHPVDACKGESLEDLAKRKGLRAEIACWLHRSGNSVVVSGAELVDAVRAFLMALPDSPAAQANTKRDKGE